MNWGELNDCFLCLPGTVVAFLSLSQEIVGTNTILYKKYFTYFVDSTEFS